jgi:SPP1 gp7 family putative phage head morphogenesis protein
VSDRLFNIAERYDRELEGISKAALERISRAYDLSYRQLIDELRQAYPNLQAAGSISALTRKGAIAAELGSALKFIGPASELSYQELGTQILEESIRLGQQMAGESLDYLGILGTFTTAPVGAIRNQAEQFASRLRNYSDLQATQISGVVEMGLVQGWGVRKIEAQLKNLGVSFKSSAETIARTEPMSAYNGAAISRYQEADVPFVQWIATPSERLCSICAARNGNVYELATAPMLPAHPRCRCAWLPRTELDDIDTEFYQKYHQEGLDDLKTQGLKVDNGPTYWERQAGLAAAPKPVWKPNDPITKKVERPNQGFFDKWAGAWSKTADLYRSVIDRYAYPGELTDPTDTAYQLDGNINMADYQPGEGRGDHVWRHEYGHAMDYRIGEEQQNSPLPQSSDLLRGMRSNSSDSLAAMESDDKRLRAAKSKGVDKKRKAFIKNLKKAQNKDGSYSLEKLISFGLEKEDANSIATFSKGDSPEEVADDMFRANSLVESAIKENVRSMPVHEQRKIMNQMDPFFQEVEKRLGKPGRDLLVAYHLYGNPEDLIEAAERLTGAGLDQSDHFRDLAGSITKNAVSQGHGDAYYDRGIDWQLVETWANVWDLLSSGDPLLEGMARRIAPAYCSFFDKVIDSIGS